MNSYLCLGYLDAAAFDRAPEEEREAILERCAAQCIPFRATGQVTAEAGLDGPPRSIRPRNGKPMVIDGPYAETREVLGSYFIIEAEDMEAALAVASLHPAAIFGEAYGFGIEVWPIR